MKKNLYLMIVAVFVFSPLTVFAVHVSEVLPAGDPKQSPINIYVESSLWLPPMPDCYFTYNDDTGSHTTATWACSLLPTGYTSEDLNMSGSVSGIVLHSDYWTANLNINFTALPQATPVPSVEAGIDSASGMVELFNQFMLVPTGVLIWTLLKLTLPVVAGLLGLWFALRWAIDYIFRFRHRNWKQDDWDEWDGSFWN